MLLDLATGDWDDELLALFGISRAVLPEVVASSGHAAEATFLGVTLPVVGIAGDQQAALFGQGCFAPATRRRRTAPARSSSSTSGSVPARPPTAC